MASDIRNDIDPKDRISRKMVKSLVKGNHNRVKLNIRDLPSMLEEDEGEE